MAIMQAKPTKEKKVSSSIDHPPYLQMITEAIASLKDRTGSSQRAIAKFLEEKYKSQLPPTFRKMLSVQLRRFSKSEKLVKVKNSYKVSAPVKASVTASTAVEKKKAPVAVAAKKPVKKGTTAAGQKEKKAATTAKPKVARKGKATSGAKVKTGVAAAAPKPKKAGAAVKKVKPLKAVKSPLGKKRVAKSIKSPKKVPAAKKARR